jgi:hypothetical protein
MPSRSSCHTIRDGPHAGCARRNPMTRASTSALI